MDKLYLTAGQIKYLFDPASMGAVGYEGANYRQKEDMVIIEQDKDSWILVANANTLHEEGAGVWVDVNGMEHHGP